VEDFQITFLDLLQAGSDTTSAFMECIILYMILYPEVQEKVNQEIQSVISPEQEVTYADAKRFDQHFPKL
jgi:cytochrome P450